MVAPNYNFSVEQGSTFSLVFTWKDENGAAINLTNYTARLKAKKDFSSTTIINLTTENGGITLGGSAGTITLNISATASAALEYGSYIYDLEVISSGGAVTKIVKGNIEVIREVTN